jgi:hypothetical protein
MQCVDRMQRFSVLKQVVYEVTTGLRRVNCRIKNDNSFTAGLLTLSAVTYSSPGSSVSVVSNPVGPTTCFGHELTNIR